MNVRKRLRNCLPETEQGEKTADLSRKRRENAKKINFFLRKGVAKIAFMWYNVRHNIRGLNESHVI